jgi:aminoglycoside phosphotransferase (APT) family kinase protein
LSETAPTNATIGLVHGDLQPGNVLYENGKAQGLIDWDLASIGPIGMDVGWLLSVADGESWARDWRPFGAPGREALLQAYRDAGGVVPADINWFQAFSHFRMAAITGLNLKLHLDGRRHDPIWERFATSVPPMLARGLALLQRKDDVA